MSEVLDGACPVPREPGFGSSLNGHTEPCVSSGNPSSAPSCLRSPGRDLWLSRIAMRSSEETNQSVGYSLSAGRGCFSWRLYPFWHHQQQT